MLRGILDSVSMDKYADRVMEGLRLSASDWIIEDMSPVLPGWLKKKQQIRKFCIYTYRYLYYPLHIKCLHADVFHITDHSHAFLLRRLQTRCSVITCHDLMGLAYPDAIRNTAALPIIAEYLYRYSLQSLHLADLVIADSENTKKDILRFTRCLPEKIQVIYLGVDPIFKVCNDESQVKEFRQRISAGDSHLMLHVGINAPYKNIPAVLETLDILKNKMGLDVKLLKVGPSFSYEQQRFIDHYGLTNRIIHLNNLTPSDLTLAYQSSDVLVFPSIYEGFGWPPLEAMACGLPVVASNAGSLTEVIEDAAITVSPKDNVDIAKAVASILTKPELRRELIFKGSRQSQKFNWEKTITQLISTYEQLWVSKRPLNCN